MNWKITLIVCVLILLAGAAITAWIFFTEPTAERVTATRETAMLVELTEARGGTFRPTIETMGTVEPAQEILLSPRVGGEVIERADAFTPGGRVRRGETLVRIDPADFRIALEQRESELRQAQAELKIEMGLQDVARQDYQLLGDDLVLEDESLVLREPQLETARARVAAARSAVEQARLALDRTEVKAPFDAQVLTREVNVGSQVAAGDPLGRLAGTEAYWVVATVPVDKLRWIAFPDAAGAPGAPVRIRDRAAWPPDTHRDGHILSLIGALEEQTRLARVLVSVPDPLALEPAAGGQPGLIIGAFVEAAIAASEIAEVVRLERDYLRQDDRVWVMEEGKLRIRPVQVVFRDRRYAYIAEGLRDGEQVVTTNLATVTEGAPLRVADGEGARGAASPGPAGGQ